MGNNILFVFEGRKAEPKIFRNINRLFFTSDSGCSNYFYGVFGTHVHQLCWEVLQDPDLDLFVLLKQRGMIKPLMPHIGDMGRDLSQLRREDFAEIYLFFDADNHDPNFDASKLEELISFFDNETEHGKLYINYPMVESLKDYHPKNAQYTRCLVPVGSNTHYKKAVGYYTCNAHVGTYTVEYWKELIRYFIRKGNCLLEDHFEMFNYDVYMEQLLQASIVRKQRDHWALQQTFMLNSIPFFLLDYFGRDFYDSCWQDINQVRSSDFS